MLEQLKQLKNVLANEFLDPFEMAKDLHDNGILSVQSYLAVLNFFPYYELYLPIEAKIALVNLLFEELVDPTTLDNFKDYARSNLSHLFELLKSMGKYYHDILSYYLSIL